MHNEIYENLNLPPNLIKHMRNVAAVSKQIMNHWQGPAIDQEKIHKTLLLHDIGNLIKTKLNTPHELKVTGIKKNQVEFYKNIKEEMIQRYGNNPEIASLKMLHELKIAPEIITLLEKKETTPIKEITKNEDWEVKICMYADMRASPFGIVSLHGRIQDIEIRYPHLIGNQKYLESNIHLKKIEKQIFKHTTIKPEDITDDSVKTQLI